MRTQLNSFAIALASMPLLYGASACAMPSGERAQVSSAEATSNGEAPTGPRDEQIPDAVGVSRLWLQADPAGDMVAVAVHYARGAASAGARVAEIVIDRSTNLELVESAAGDAATAAGKQVIVQEPDSAHLRILVFSSASTTELSTGEVATLHLRRTSNSTATLDLNTDKPIFAPAQANEGLSVGDPLDVE